MKNPFVDLIKETGNEYAGAVDDGIEAGDVTGYVGTGSYALNALFSGSIYGGLPHNKITALAGEPATGKTFYTLNVVKQFLIDNPDGGVLYFESESALTKQMFVDRGIDAKRVHMIPVTTIQEFRTQCIKVLDKYLQTPEAERPPMLMALDSLGNLSTEKEVSDMSEGKDTRDMTRAQLIRGAFRVITLKLGRAKVALVVTNHTYDAVGAYIPTKKMSGGTGLEYAASTIVFLSKKKEKQNDEVVGNIVKCRLQKSRLTIADKVVETLLRYDSGVDKYYGLLDIAIKAGIFKKVSTRYELPDGTKAFEKNILESPEKYYTKDILNKIDEYCKKEFLLYCFFYFTLMINFFLSLLTLFHFFGVFCAKNIIDSIKYSSNKPNNCAEEFSHFNLRILL